MRFFITQSSTKEMAMAVMSLSNAHDLAQRLMSAATSVRDPGRVRERTRVLMMLEGIRMEGVT